MMPREVPGGIVRRWYCYNPNCQYPFHETRWCPEQMSAAVAAPPSWPLSQEQEKLLWERAERLRRRAEEAERARLAQPAAAPEPEYRWLLVVIPVGLLLIVVILGAVFRAYGLSVSQGGAPTGSILARALARYRSPRRVILGPCHRPVRV